MTRDRALVLAAALVLFFGVGAYLVHRSSGGGGQAVSVHLAVSGGSMAPADPSVKQGDTVTMTITADRREEIHLHGYDVPFQVPGPGESVTHSFTADKSGSFPIEIEDTGTPLGELVVKP